jgi:hypothetical protein
MTPEPTFPAAARNQIAALQNQLAALTTERDGLRRQVTTLSNQVKDANGQIEDLRARNGAFGEVFDLYKQLEDLNIDQVITTARGSWRAGAGYRHHSGRARHGVGLAAHLPVIGTRCLDRRRPGLAGQAGGEVDRWHPGHSDGAGSDQQLRLAQAMQVSSPRCSTCCRLARDEHQGGLAGNGRGAESSA